MWLIEMIKESTENPEKKFLAKVLTSWTRIYSTIQKYMFGLILNFVIMSFLKSLTGEPRPHFLDMCKPDKGLNCSKG